MSLDIAEMKVLKMKLFELLDGDATNIALGAAQFLVQLAQIPEAGIQGEYMDILRKVESHMQEDLDRDKRKKAKKDESKTD